MTHVVINNNETYVYLNGQLIYKKWRDSGYSLIFNKGHLPQDYRTRESITDKGRVVNS